MLNIHSYGLEIYASSVFFYRYYSESPCCAFNHDKKITKKMKINQNVSIVVCWKQKMDIPREKRVFLIIIIILFHFHYT